MNWENQAKQVSFYLQQMEKRIPKDDILRIIDDKIDFSFVTELAKPYYSRLGPIGYSPERLFKMLVVMYMENIPSERKLVEQLNLNIKYMWFTQTDLDSPVPDHSTFSVLRSRLGDELFKRIFEGILSRIIDAGIAHPKSISVDSTSVLADVKAPKDKNKDTKQAISSDDPDARYGRTSKDKKDSFFGYKAQIMVDNDKGFILNIDAKPGNAEDSSIEEGFIKEPIDNHKPIEAALDKGFDTYRIRRLFKEQKVKAAIPVKSTKYDNSNLYTKDAFDIDLKNKKVTCPAGKELKYTGFDNKKLNHLFIATECNSCRLKARCTTGKVRQLKIHQDYLLREKAIKFNKSKQYTAIYNKRTCVERVIGEAKRFHGMLRSKFRRLWKLKIQLYLTAIAINLKRVAKFFIEQPNIGASLARAGP